MVARPLIVIEPPAVPRGRPGGAAGGLPGSSVVAVDFRHGGAERRTGLVAAVIGTARAMFLSQHDFEVALLVAGVAGVVSLAFALLVARWAIAGARAVQDAIRLLGERGTFVAPPDTSPRYRRSWSGQRAESRQRERTLEASRRELVAWVSHDLRTPLAGLRAMAEASRMTSWIPVATTGRCGRLSTR